MDPFSIAAAAITGASSIIGTGYTLNQQGKLNKQNREWQEKMHNLQRAEAVEDMNTQMDFQREAWDYASLPNQVRMAKEAGINPASVFGNAGVQQGVSGSVHTREAGAPLPSATANPGDAIMSTVSMLARALPDMINAEANKKNSQTNERVAGFNEVRAFADALKAGEEAKLISARTAGQLLDNKLSAATFDDNVSLARDAVVKQQAEIEKIGAESQYYSGMVSMLKAQQDELLAKADMLRAQTDNIRSDTSLTEERRQLLIEQACSQFWFWCKMQSEKNGVEIRNSIDKVYLQIAEDTKEGKITKENAEAEITAFKNKVKELDRRNQVAWGYMYGVSNLLNSAALSYRGFVSPHQTLRRYSPGSQFEHINTKIAPMRYNDTPGDFSFLD